MSTIDQQFVEYIVKTLVNNPDKVSVERTIDEKGVLLQLTVDPEDVGRVIGRRGATAQSLRTLLRALGTKNDAHYNLKITNDGAPRRDDAPKSAPKTEQADNAADKPAEDNIATTEAATDDSTPADDSSEDDSYGGDDFDDDTSDLAEKTRAELADMDDLDI
ncbi:KH domain-containing protein [Candidatus Saccharibacteria bacterium]|nr:KH domain-containing protein [Candidatus Saccharibacteria bacterium]